MVFGLLQLFTALSCLMSVNAFAEDFKPEEIPPQKPLKLYRVKGAHEIHYLVTCDSRGNHYVLVNENGKLRFPRQSGTGGFVYSDGGSMDLPFENGERLLIPTEALKAGYLGVVLPPMMMSADRAPYMLEKVELSEAVLKQLGFAEFLTPPTQQTDRRSSTEETYIPFVSPETGQVIEFTSAAKLGYSEESDLIKQISQLDPARIKASDRGSEKSFLTGTTSLIIIITEPDVSLPKLKALLKGRGQVKAVSQNLLNRISKDIQKIASRFEKSSAEEQLKLVKEIFQQLGRLEHYFANVDYHTKYETAFASHRQGVKDSYVGTAYNIRARRDHPFYSLILAKIRNTALSGYHAFDQMGHPAAQEILAHTSQGFDYAALDITRGQAKVGQQYYFDLWLKFMLSDLDFIDKIEGSSTLPDGIRLSNRSGGMFNEFKVSGDFVGINSSGMVPHYFDDRPKFLLNLLGLPGDKDRLKTSLLQFIIDADKQAKKIVEWSNRRAAAQGRYNDSFDAKGITNIFSLLSAMSWTPYWAKAIDDFSTSEYQITVMEVFTTLFDITSTSLQTTGTITALIDSSIHILNSVQNADDSLSQEQSSRLWQAAYGLETRLRHHLTQSIVGLSFARTPGVVDACEILLSPNPYLKARQANGW